MMAIYNSRMGIKRTDLLTPQKIWPLNIDREIPALNLKSQKELMTEAMENPALKKWLENG